MRILAAMFAISLLVIPLTVYASTTGVVNEVVGNEEMQLYVTAWQEASGEGPNKRVDMEVIIKNLEPDPRAFNIFFVKVVDLDGNEYKVSPLLSTIMPIRIPTNDIIRGTLTFPVPIDAEVSTLVWEEPNSKLTVDLKQVKESPDPVPSSEWVLSANKGKEVSDGRTELTIHDERLNKDPPYYHVDISIKNISNEPVSYSATYSFVKDQNGYLYPPDVTNLQLMYNPLKQGELKPGEEVRGEVLFPLPKGVSNVMFIYDEQLGRGSYFAVPEFPYHVLILGASIVTGLILARMKYFRVQV